MSKLAMIWLYGRFFWFTLVVYWLAKEKTENFNVIFL